MSQPYDRDDVLSIARAIRYDLTAAQAKLTDLLGAVARMEVKPSGRASCPECGVSVDGPRKLAEHAYLQHNGPEPAHWRDAEAKADG